MRRRSLSTIPLLVPFLLAAFAGCADPSMQLAVEPNASTARTEPGSSTHRNQFLLDLPHPQSTTVSAGAEPVILADHLGKYLWIGDTSGISISDDGGATWTKSVDPFTTGCDGNPLAQDATGRLWTANTACATIQWASSDDFGKTWNPAPVPIVGYTIDAAPIADRPWIAARGDGEASILYYDFGRTTGETCLRTMDGGTTWLDRGVGPLKMNAGNAVYDSKGQLYYGTGRNIYRYASTCAAGSTAFAIAEPVGQGVFEVIDVDENDALYMAVPSQNNDQIVLYGTRDFATRTSLRLSPPELVTNTYATVSAAHGMVAVAWYATETAGDFGAQGFPGEWNVFVAVITGFWSEQPTISFHRVTDEPNHVGQFCLAGVSCLPEDDRDLLDYFGITISNDRIIHVAYGHDGAGTAREVRHAALAPSQGVIVPVAAPKPIDSKASGSASSSGPRPSPSSGNAAPRPAFTAETDGRTLHVDASETRDPEGDAITYAWDWGDGHGGDSGETQEHIYSSDGQFVVTLTATDAFGASRTVQRQIAVDDGIANRAPKAAFSIDPADPRPGGEVQFIDSSSDEDGRIVSYHWAFGDGTTSEKRYPRRTFVEGTYSIELTVRDDSGATDSLVQPMVVDEPAEPAAKPMSAPSSRPPETVPGLTVVFLLFAAFAVAFVRRRTP